jgi:hypothetical protein
MKVYAFKVVPDEESTHPPEIAFEHFAKNPLSGRMRELSHSRIRLEDFKKKGSHLFLNFVLFRTGSGPAIVSDSNPIAEIEIEDDEFFGEDTACLYDPKTRYLLIQYNHHGPKASTIEEYLTYSEDERIYSYQLVPKLSPASEARIMGLHLVSKLEVSFAVPDLSNVKDSSSLSVGAAIKLGQQQGAQTMMLSLGNRSGLAASAVKELAISLLRAASGDSGVKRLSVRAQVDKDSPRETIDLVAERLSAEVEIPLGSGRRYSLDERWSHLAQIHKTWLARGLLV